MTDPILRNPVLDKMDELLIYLKSIKEDTTKIKKYVDKIDAEYNKKEGHGFG